MREIAGEIKHDVRLYFMLWLGLVGPSVGLSVPSELARVMINGTAVVVS